MNKTFYEYCKVLDFVPCDETKLRSLAISELGRKAKIAFDSRAEFSYKVEPLPNIRSIETAYYHCRFKLTLPLRQFEIREGNGNEGEYRRGYVNAVDSFEALRIASRQGMIVRPWDVKIDSMDGDDTHAYLVSYVAPIYGDSCRWCASASLVVPE